jgi:L-Ala-D/L-Glu epimerase
MNVIFRRIELHKLFPLVISRGGMASSENLFVTVESEGQTGVGELSPATGSDWTAERGERQLRDIVGQGIEGLAIHEVWSLMKDAQVDPPAMAALDVALWDLHAKKADMPLYKLFGLPKKSVPTSVTIGINPPEVTRERVPQILRMTGARCLKIKLGSPEGRDHDKAHFEAAREASAPFGAKLRVDANGGWTMDEAKMMLRWLAERGVDYVEQPLVEGAEDELLTIFEGRPLPIFADESCRFSSDVVKLAGKVDGINLKLMKCGGLTEALRIVATAKAHGLRTMIGCMSESSVAIGAGAAIGALFDYIDLDSHLNLNPDCASGLDMLEGVVTPPDVPGHGARLCDA